MNTVDNVSVLYLIIRRKHHDRNILKNCCSLSVIGFHCAFSDVVVSPVIAIYGETSTTKTCVVSPRGNWDHLTVTVENQGIPYVIRKYYSNKSFEEPTSLERFNTSISSTDTAIVVYLTLDLQAPTTNMCSWNGIYTFLCSITMNDSISTRVYNVSQILITSTYTQCVL